MYTVSGGGYNTLHSSSFMMFRPFGLADYLLLITKSRTKYTLGNNHFTAEPDHAVLIDRNTPYRYYNPDGNYSDDWLHFDCAHDGTFKKNCIICNEPIPIGNPSRFTIYIQQILWENNYAEKTYRSDNVDMTVRVLLNNLAAASKDRDTPRQYSPYYSRLQELRLSLQANPAKKYSVENLAKSLGVSPSYFQYLYSTFLGISFQADLISMRIGHAKTLIHSTNLTFDQIAEICGYSSEVHFYRQFRQKTGMTPKTYRDLKKSS